MAYPNTQYFSGQQTDIARRLVAIGDPAVVDSIGVYLDTTDRRRRCNAAYVLAAFGDERGTQVLVGEGEDTGTDARDAEGGGRHVGPPNREADLRQQVVSDRYFAALLLGELRSKAAVPARIAATRDSTINYRAAMSLGEIGDPSTLPALREMIERFPGQKTWAG